MWLSHGCAYPPRCTMLSTDTTICCFLFFSFLSIELLLVFLFSQIRISFNKTQYDLVLEYLSPQKKIPILLCIFFLVPDQFHPNSIHNKTLRKRKPPKKLGAATSKLCSVHLQWLPLSGKVNIYMHKCIISCTHAKMQIFIHTYIHRHG